ncbi:hypothetical protein MMC30_000260 [Trapelia coarctata]|nr:hypothetical protein [Trapelia coarctata]
MSTSISTSTSAPRPLPHLPFEILSQILGHLPTPSLTTARLTSTTWATIGAHHLLPRIYLAPRPHTIATFTAICAHPIFSKTVKELVYDDTLLEGALTHRAAHEAAVIRRALDKGLGLPSERELEASWRVYEGGFERQEGVLEGVFEGIVREGVRRLTDLRKVIVLGSESLEARFLPAAAAAADEGKDEDEAISLSDTRQLSLPSHGLNLHWYLTTGPLSIDCAGTLPPSTWGTFNDQLEDPSGWDDWFADEKKERVDDARGRRMLLRVLEEEGREVEVEFVGEKEARRMVERGRVGDQRVWVMGEGEIERLLEEGEVETERVAWEFDEPDIGDHEWDEGGLGEPGLDQAELDEDWFSLVG